MNIKQISGGWFQKTKEEQADILHQLQLGLMVDMEMLDIEYDILFNKIKLLQVHAEAQEDYESASLLGELYKNLEKEINGV
jgi:hypothetical protein